jgi:hypothetical protein
VDSAKSANNSQVMHIEEDRAMVVAHGRPLRPTVSGPVGEFEGQASTALFVYIIYYQKDTTLRLGGRRRAPSELCAFFLPPENQGSAAWCRRVSPFYPHIDLEKVRFAQWPVLVHTLDERARFSHTARPSSVTPTGWHTQPLLSARRIREVHGRVQWYDPVSQQGRLTTADGRSFSFGVTDSTTSIQGGDVVRFGIVDEHGRQRAAEVEIVQRCVDYLSDQQHQLLDQFHSTVSIQP